MSYPDPTMRSLIGSIGAHTLWASGADPDAQTRPARVAFNARFHDQVDPDRKLPPEERDRRAAHARSAYFHTLALKSVASRRRAAAAVLAAEEAEAALRDEFGPGTEDAEALVVQDAAELPARPGGAA